MRSASKGGGFTVVELLIVLGVITVLASLLFPVLGSVREEARAAKCLSNLQQIALAAQMYSEDYKGLPLAPLPAALADYVDTAELFTCPNDKPGADSYSAFFVARSGPGRSHFVVGCPRHRQGDKAAIAFGGGAGETDRVCDVRWNGQPVQPGMAVQGGQLTFTDGSKVSIAPDTTVGVLMSFATAGTTYSIIWVPENCLGGIYCEITPGSRFEVLTPAAIAGVQGTKFIVSTASDCEYNYTTVTCYEGSVAVRGHGSSHDIEVKAGKRQRVGRHKTECFNWTPDQTLN